MRRFRSLVVVAVALLSLIASHGFADAPDTASLLAQDARLETKVTFEQRQARIGELFDAVEKQTGVHLIVEDRDGAAGEMISVFVRDLPVATLMKNVWSLVSFQRGEWRWIITQDSEKKLPPVYRLVRPVAAREYPALLKTEIEKYAAKLMEVSIKNSVASSPDPREAEIYPESVLSITDKRVRMKMRAFAALSSPPERLELLQGKGTREVAKSAWPSDVSAYINSELEVAKAAIASHPEWRDASPNLKLPDPQKVTIYQENVSGKLTPNLWFSADGMGSYALVGSSATEKYWEDWVAGSWLLPGDQKTDGEKETLKYTASEPEPSGSIWFAGEAPNQAVMRLKQLHEQTGLPVLARLTGADINVTQNPQKIPTVADVQAILRERKVLLKWSGGTLLAMDTAWLRRAEELELQKIPWAVLQKVRLQIASDPLEAPSLASVCLLASTLTEKQMHELGKQQSLLPLPASPTLSNFCDALVKLRVVLSELGRHPELQTAVQDEQGIAVRSLPPALQEWAKPILGDNIPLSVRLRLTHKDINNHSLPTHTNRAMPAFTGNRIWRFFLFHEGVPEPNKPENQLGAYEFSWDGHPRRG